jgi:RNA polymerase sigma-70 factor (ECF subfamily)
LIETNYIKGLNKGDKKVFRKIFEEYYASLILFGNRFLKDIERSEDIVQESFLDLWDKRTNLYSVNGLKSYLYTTVKNKAINLIRRDKLKDTYATEEERKDNEFDFESFFIEEESLRLFYSIIDELPDSQREVIIKTLDGYNREEIAEMMNISVDTIKYHKAKAYICIRERLGTNYFLLLIVAQILKF